MTRIPPSIDQQLLDEASRIAGEATTLCDALGWLREDYVGAIHARLRVKWREREVASV